MKYFTKKKLDKRYGNQCTICNVRTNKRSNAKYCPDCEKDMIYLTRYNTIGVTAPKARNIVKHFRKKKHDFVRGWHDEDI